MNRPEFSESMAAGRGQADAERNSEFSNRYARAREDQAQPR